MEIGGIIGAAGVPTSLALMNSGFVVMLAGALVCRAPLWRMPGFVAGCALAGWIVVSIVTTIALGRDAHPAKGFGLGYFWLAPSLTAFALQRADVRRAALIALASGMAIAATLASAQFAIGWNHHEGPWRIDPENGLRWQRASGFFGSGLTLGGVAALCGWALFGAWRSSCWCRFGLGGSAVALVVSMSRMAWIAAFAGWCVASAIARHWRRLTLAVIVLPLIGVTMLYAFKPDALRAAARGDDGRWVIWSTSATLVADHPLIGCGGRDAFNRQYAERWSQRYGDGAGLFVVEPSVAHAHNSLLSIAVEHGVPAAALHVAWWIVVLAAAWRRRRAAADAWANFAAVAATALVAGVFNNIAGQGEYGHAIGLGLGLALVALAQHEPGEAASARAISSAATTAPSSTDQ